MKRILFIALCACSATSFAQTGFFIQPEIGVGISNTNWQFFSPNDNRGLKNMFSDKFGIKAGYQNEKWEFTAGIGYLNTGYQMESHGGFGPGVTQEYFSHAWPVPNIIGTYSMHDPHIVLPLEAGYKIHLNSKLVFMPSICITAMYNLPRHVVTKMYLSDGDKESSQDFKTNCNEYGLLGTVQFNFEYTLTHKIALIAGPDAQYMLTSVMKKPAFSIYAPQYDHAFLMNIGLKYCFSKKHNNKVATGALKSAQ